jgi:hypothetical protein
MGEKITVTGKRRRIRISHILIILLLLIAGCFILFRINTKKQLRSKIEAMRAAGYPITMEELHQKYATPSDSENAADLILTAMYDYYKEPNNTDIEKLLTASNSDIPVRTKNYSQEIVTLIGQFLKENEKALEILHKASGLQYCSYPENFYEIEGFLNLTKSIKLLNLQALYFTEIGNADSSLRALISSFNIVRLFANEPRFIFHITRKFYYDQMILNIKYILNKAEFTDEQLIQLEEAFTDALDFSDLYRFYEEDMCKIFDIFRDDDNIEEDILPREVPLPAAQFYIFFYKHLGIVDTDRISYLDYMSRYIEAAKLPLQERYDTFEKIEEDFKKLSGFHILTTMFTGLNRNIDNDKQVITRIQAAKAAIAVKRYCLANDSLPDSIKDLIPAYLDKIPVTPDGKELKYKKISEGCIIYSEENKKNNINKTPPQSDLINHGIPNLGGWFVIEFEKGASQ